MALSIRLAKICIEQALRHRGRGELAAVNEGALRHCRFLAGRQQAVHQALHIDRLHRRFHMSGPGQSQKILEQSKHPSTVILDFRSPRLSPQQPKGAKPSAKNGI